MCYLSNYLQNKLVVTRHVKQRLIIKRRQQWCSISSVKASHWTTNIFCFRHTIISKSKYTTGIYLTNVSVYIQRKYCQTNWWFYEYCQSCQRYMILFYISPLPYQICNGPNISHGGDVWPFHFNKTLWAEDQLYCCRFKHLQVTIHSIWAIYLLVKCYSFLKAYTKQSYRLINYEISIVLWTWNSET